jgi:hypothetical protein
VGALPSVISAICNAIAIAHLDMPTQSAEAANAAPRGSRQTAEGVTPEACLRHDAGD